MTHSQSSNTTTFDLVKEHDGLRMNYLFFYKKNRSVDIHQYKRRLVNSKKSKRIEKNDNSNKRARAYHVFTHINISIS